MMWRRRRRRREGRKVALSHPALVGRRGRREVNDTWSWGDSTLVFLFSPSLSFSHIYITLFSLSSLFLFLSLSLSLSLSFSLPVYKMCVCVCVSSGRSTWGWWLWPHCWEHWHPVAKGWFVSPLRTVCIHWYTVAHFCVCQFVKCFIFSTFFL